MLGFFDVCLDRVDSYPQTAGGTVKHKVRGASEWSSGIGISFELIMLICIVLTTPVLSTIS